MKLNTSVLFWLSGVSNALIHGLDSADSVPTSAWVKALSDGFTKAIPRGYQESCSVGGKVDPNFVTSYLDARDAGFVNIDTYWIPCTGSGNKCKPFETQISEIKSTIQSNKMHIGRIWIGIESSKECHPWNYGAQGNIAMAKQLFDAARRSTLDFGVYSSASQWSNIFGSKDVVLASALPLWFAKFDKVETLELGTPFGGWRGTVNGHQYTDKSSLGPFDLNVFSI